MAHSYSLQEEASLSPQCVVVLPTPGNKPKSLNYPIYLFCRSGSLIFSNLCSVNSPASHPASWNAGMPGSCALTGIQKEMPFSEKNQRLSI